MVDRDEFAVEGPQVGAVALHNLLEHRLDSVFFEFRFHEGEGELGTHQGDVLAQFQQERHGADVVFVPVGENYGLDVVQPVFDVGKVRQDEVNTGFADVVGEEYPAVDDEEPPSKFQYGHVPADGAQSPEGDYPQTSLRQSVRIPEFEVRCCH